MDAAYKVFVTNLKREPDKKEHITRQLDAAGIQAEIFEAVDGKELSEAQLDELVYDHKNCALPKGTIGNALSKQIMYKRMIDENIPLVLMLEDDAVFQPRTLAVREEIALNDESAKPTVYLLSHATDYLPLTKRALKTCTLYKLYRGYNNHGYVLNLAAAKKLYELQSPVLFESDRWEHFKLILNFDIYCAIPHVIDTADSGKQMSSIEAERKPLLKQRTAYKSRMAREKFPLFTVKKLFYRTVVRLFSKKNPK